MRKTAYATIALALVIILAGVACARFRIKSEDEGPIIVKNGSMTIDTDDQNAAWKDDNGVWSNETGKNHHGDLWVLVTLKDGTKCGPKSGNPVHIEYSIQGFTAKFNVVGNPSRTKVSPKNDLSRQSDQRLRYGTDGDGGYITGVKVNGSDLSCGMTKDNLAAINICSSQDVKACQ